MTREREKSYGASAPATMGPSESGYAFDSWTIVLGLFALSNLGNGLWMLAAPVHW